MRLNAFSDTSGNNSFNERLGAFGVFSNKLVPYPALTEIRSEEISQWMDRVRSIDHASTSLHTHTHIHIYILVFRFHQKVITFSCRWRKSGHYSLHLIYRRRTRKQWLSKEHFAENTSERPHIDTLRVPEYVAMADQFTRM